PAPPPRVSLNRSLRLTADDSSMGFFLRAIADERLVQAHALQAGIHVEPVAAQEADEGDPEFTCQRYGQAAGRGYGANDGHPRHERFLEDLEAAPAADHDDVVTQRQLALEERPAHELVERVVPSHVLPHD